MDNFVVACIITVVDFLVNLLISAGFVRKEDKFKTPSLLIYNVIAIFALLITTSQMHNAVISTSTFVIFSIAYIAVYYSKKR